MQSRWYTTIWPVLKHSDKYQFIDAEQVLRARSRSDYLRAAAAAAAACTDNHSTALALIGVGFVDEDMLLRSILCLPHPSTTW